jgi:hypothetical protein
MSEQRLVQQEVEPTAVVDGEVRQPPYARAVATSGQRVPQP